MDRMERVEELLADGWGVSFTKYADKFVASMNDGIRKPRQAYGESLGEVIELLHDAADCTGI